MSLSSLLSNILHEEFVNLWIGCAHSSHVENDGTKVRLRRLHGGIVELSGYLFYVLVCVWAGMIARKSNDVDVIVERTGDEHAFQLSLLEGIGDGLDGGGELFW